jgi:hypothetical protein
MSDATYEDFLNWTKTQLEWSIAKVSQELRVSTVTAAAWMARWDKEMREMPHVKPKEED